MKLLNILTIAAVLGLTPTQQANAEYIPGQIKGPLLGADLNAFNLNPAHAPGHVNGGYLSINKGAKHIQVQLMNYSRCPANARCLHALPIKLLDRTLPLVKIERSACGTIIYTAVKDMRPAGGIYSEIIVADMSKNHCAKAEKWATVVRYTTKSGNNLPVKTSYFYGSVLEQLMHTMTR